MKTVDHKIQGHAYLVLATVHMNALLRKQEKKLGQEEAKKKPDVEVLSSIEEEMNFLEESITSMQNVQNYLLERKDD